MTIVAPTRAAAASRTRLFTYLLVAGLALTGAACGTTIDMPAVSKSVSDGLASQLSLPIASVTCPTESRAAKAGDTFECIATPTVGGRLTVTVTQQDDKGNVKWEVAKTEGLIDLTLVEQAVTSGLKEQAGIDATVTCGGGKFRASKPGEAFDCQAKAADGRQAVVGVTVKDTDGNIGWAVKE